MIHLPYIKRRQAWKYSKSYVENGEKERLTISNDDTAVNEAAKTTVRESGMSLLLHEEKKGPGYLVRTKQVSSHKYFQ